eukprot:Pompholyxophrys_punicea_v1_NODE_730_length_1385_cov_8.607062.p2 type:complete len:157 gc:universal NODE_730_length_1385_cov_8.607062:665-1135(+)
MIDGKVVGHLTDTHTTNCTLCKATPSMLNNISLLINLPIDENGLDYGLSVMHLWIRSLEYMWNVARKLEVKKGRSDKSIEAVIKERENFLRKKNSDTTGLLIDVPKAGGSGNTNDGNTARRFFAEYEKISEITGLDKNILYNLGIFHPNIILWLSC